MKNLERNTEKQTNNKMDQVVKVATGAFIVKDGKVLLGTGPKFTPYWTVPGGKLAFGEKSSDCVKREVKEELNVEIQITAEPIYTEKMVKISSNLTHFIFINFLCRIVTGEPEADGREFTEIKWQKIEEALNDETINISARETLQDFKKLNKP